MNAYHRGVPSEVTHDSIQLQFIALRFDYPPIITVIAVIAVIKIVVLISFYPQTGFLFSLCELPNTFKDGI